MHHFERQSVTVSVTFLVAIKHLFYFFKNFADMSQYTCREMGTRWRRTSWRRWITSICWHTQNGIPQRTSSDRTLHWHWMEVCTNFICYMGHLTYQGQNCAGTGWRYITLLSATWVISHTRDNTVLVLVEVYNTFICYMGHLTYQGQHCACTGWRYITLLSATWVISQIRDNTMLVLVL